MEAIDATLVAGFLLSMIRVGAFVVSSPLFSKTVPVPGRIALTLALSVFLTTPFADLGTGALLGAAVVNAAVGIVLGIVTGLPFAMFNVAGGFVDVTSGLSVAAVIDPNQGGQAAIFNRTFGLVALVMFVGIGGDHLLVQGLALSLETIPLDGAVSLEGSLLQVVATASGRLLVAGAELALPAVAALFLTEVGLGLASRFAPQANLFVLGMPLRVLITLATASVVFLGFPAANDGLLRLVCEAFVDGLRGLGAG